jgi:hypothetical protein
MPWQFAYAGNEYAWLGQYWSRWELYFYYTNRFDGIPGVRLTSLLSWRVVPCRVVPCPYGLSYGVALCRVVWHS